MAIGRYRRITKFCFKKEKNDDDSYLKPTRRDRETFFLRNGAELLAKLIEFSDARCNPIRIFSAKAIEKATNDFAENSETLLQVGSLDKLYKGNFEGRAVTVSTKSREHETTPGVVTNTPSPAVKTPSSVINEVAVLSRINHPNVAKVVGCCLETSTPIPVYEELPNQTLSQRLHTGGSSSTHIPWQNRLQIMTEIAYALTYMHIGTATPIIHRDIKSQNILVSEDWGVKIFGFDLLVSIPFGETQTNCNVVGGTFGYVDPVHFLTSRLSDKSDVFSYGALLVEVLSGRKPLDGDSNLAVRFLRATEEERLSSFVDSGVLEEAKKEQVIAWMSVAERCLRETWEERPEMKQVVQELLRIRGL